MALRLWETLEDAITVYTGLTPATFFTGLALGLAIYYVLSSLFGSSGNNQRKSSRDLQEEMQPLPPPVQLGEVTEEELKVYDGSDPKRPLLMAIKGQIYDVTQSRMFYGPGGPYALFAGKDASRALAKMSFEEQDLTGDISGLGPFELDALQDWEYKFMTKYAKVEHTLSMDALSVVDIAPFLKNPKSQDALDACNRVVAVLKSTSCLIVRDPRVKEEENVAFLDLVEKYFSQPRDELMHDVHPELSYQLGATPEFTEIPRDHKDVINKLDPKYSAHIPEGPDPKWRFFWRIGERPSSSAFPELNAPPVVPSHFTNWETVMNRWGNLMLDTVTTVAQMVAVGSGLPENAITDLMHQGPHLLAPTGSDLSRFNKLETVFAGFHYDFNLLTIHGKSRFPGLFIWLRDGSRLQVRVPDGCLLLQAGKQMEWITGGDISAGFHEVVVVEDTLAAVKRAQEANRPLWRVSSTLFAHVNSDKTLEPLPPFKNEASLTAYPPTLAGKQAEDELKMIALQQK